MKILFLYINAYKDTGIPIGLSYLIPVLEQQGHKISVFETTFIDVDYGKFNISERIDHKSRRAIEDFRKQVVKINPDLIGVSSASLCLNFAIEMLKDLRNRPITIFGGVGPTTDYENLIKQNVVDYVCVGFGEECLSSLIDNLENRTNLNDVPNLVYKLDGKIKINRFRQQVNLARLPVPDWRLFDKRHFLRIFKNKIRRWGNFQLTRGCPFNCFYCINAFYHKELKVKIQKFPPEQIVREIKVLAKKYNLEIIRMFDECFGLRDINYYREFGRLYEQATDLPSIIETRPEAITPELIKVLKEDMHCISVSLGIEVGNEKQREQLLDRKLSNRTIKRAFELLHEAEIRTSAFNIMGFPNDTKELIFETIEFNRQCKPDFINCFIFSPFPKTKLREYCEKNGLLETKAIVDYTLRSVIKNEKLSKKELFNLYNSFCDYIREPECKWKVRKKSQCLR